MLTCNCSFGSVFIALTLSTWLTMRLENARRDKKARTNPAYLPLSSLEGEVVDVPLDETDRQNKRFRYAG
jgi:hypothetical protein